MRASFLVAGTAIVLAAAGFYYGLEIYPQQRFRANVDQAIARLPPGTTVAYKGAHYSIISHAAEFTGLTMHADLPGPQPRSLDIAIDSFAIENPNLALGAAWNAARENPSAITPDRALPVADTITLKGVTVRSAVLNMTEDSAVLNRARLYPWPLLHDGVPSWADVLTAIAAASQPPTLDDPRPLLRGEAALMLGFAYDSYSVGATKLTETLGDLQIGYDIRAMRGEGYDRGLLKSASADAIVFRGDKLGTFATDRLTIGSSDFRAPITRLVNGEPLSAAMLDGMRIGRLEYHGITFQPPGQPPGRAGGIFLGPVVFAGGLPVSGEMGWTDVTISQQQLPDQKSRDVMDQIGLETMTTSFALAYDWDVAGRHASLRETMLKINELGTLSLTAEVNDVVPGAAAATQTRLVHARLRFDDASLVERLIRTGAARSGADPALFRQQIAMAVLRQGSTPGQVTPAMSAADQALSDFITAPRTLTLELSPPVPVSFAALRQAAASPSSLVTMLGLVVTANAP
jgi:hypothetical protein